MLTLAARLICILIHVSSLFISVSANQTVPLSGQFEVSQQGAATYTLPIEAPIARGGLKPEVSLVYSSSNGDGNLGQGWSLSASSVISRCPQSFSQDGQLKGVDLSMDDRFCLDGMRLVLVSGQYGAANSQYRREMDDASLVTALGQNSGGGPEAFKVETKSGETHYFGDISTLGNIQFSDIEGNTTSGDAAITIEAESGEVTRLWALKAIEDNLGNYIAYHYLKTDSEQVLSSIDYSGHSEGELPYTQIKFHYIANPNAKAGYVYGQKFSSTKLLSRIEITLDGQHQRSYFLDYSTSTALEDKSYIDSIQACVDPERMDCTAAISFDWTRRALNSASFNPFASNHSISMPKGENLTAQTFDMDGDGFVDMVYVRDGTWYKRTLSTGEESRLTSFGSAKAHFAQSIEFNGDGQRDLLIAASESENWKVISFTPSTETYSSCEPNGGGTQLCEDIDREVVYTLTDLNRKAVGFEGNTLVADVNGDALEDIVFMENKQIQWYQNLGGTFDTAKVLYSFGTGETGAFEPKITLSAPGFKTSAAVDVNGDGLTDLLLEVKNVIEYCSTGSGIVYNVELGECVGDLQGQWHSSETIAWRLYVSDGSHFVEQQILTGTDDVERLRVADLNGDGLTDIVYVRDDIWRQRVSNGLHFLRESELGEGNVGIEANDTFDKGTFFLDLNGDGRSDMLRPTAGDMHVFISKPSTDADIVDWEERGKFPLLGSIGDSIRFADTHADGRIDLYYVQDAQWRLSSSTTPIFNNTINKITDGFGVETNVTYKYITDTGTNQVYKTQVSSNLDPSKNFSTIPALQVVSRVQTATGINTSVGVKYEYGGLLVNRLGRGFQGFELLRTIDEQSNVITETQYAQIFPRTGLPIATQQHYNNVVLSESLNTYTFTALSSNETAKIFRRTQMDSTDTSRQYGSDDVVRDLVKIQSRHEYDEWSNLTKSTIEKTDLTSFSSSNRVATTNVYAGEGGGAAKGRLSHTVVEAFRFGDGSAPTVTQSSEFSYYSNGLLKTSVLSPDDNRYKLTTTKQYDKYGNTTQVDVTGGSDALGSSLQTRTSRTTYGDRGRFVHSVTNSVGDTSSSQYNQQAASQVTGRITRASITDTNGRKASKFFDFWGRVTQELNPDLTQTLYRYEQCANADCTPFSAGYLLTSKSKAGSPSEQVISDKYGREIGRKVKGFNGQWVVTAKTYDAKGRMTRQYEPDFGSIGQYYSEVQYDDFNRVVGEQMPNGSTSTRHYQGLDTLLTDGNGKQKSKTINAFGEQAKITDELYNELTFDYDAKGRLLRSYVQSSGGVKVLRTALQYDNYGRKIQSTDLDKGVWHYSYNAFGELLSQTNASGQVTQLQYDLLGRKIKRAEPEGVSCWLYGNESTNTVGMLITERLYGSAVNDCSASGYKQQKTYDYDNFGRLTSTATEIENITYSTAFTYDDMGRISTLQYPNNLLTVENSYNDAGYLFQRKNQDTGLAYQTIISMNARGKITQVDYGNGAQENTTYQSDTGWVDNIKLEKKGGVHDLSYRFDEVGNLSWRQHQLSSAPAVFAESYDYDDLYRLYDRTVTVQSGSSTLPVDFKNTISTRYDDWGNIVSKTGTGAYRYDATNPYRLLDICTDGNCNSTESIAATQSCPLDFTLNSAGTSCEKTDIVPASPHVTYSCPSGYTLSGMSCQKQDIKAAIESIESSCPNGYAYNSTSNICSDSFTIVSSSKPTGEGVSCDKGEPMGGGRTLWECTRTAVPTTLTVYSCDSGWSLSGTQCSRLSTQIAAEQINYTCDSGWSLSGTSCAITSNVAVNYSCSAGWSQAGTQCTRVREPRYKMQYDERGNVINDGGRVFNYTSHDLVNSITQGGELSEFEYDASRARFKRSDVKIEAGVNAYYTTHYVGSHYEKVLRTGGGKATLTEQKLYVGNAVITVRSNNSTDTFYLHEDHQGSTTTITNASGNVVQQFTYDPWGKQTAVFTSSLLGNYASPAERKGYTGHESISHLDIIHMNGRIYDATIGRFLQADPFIQQADNLQNYNRYAYVMNNPMSYTDPSGFFFDKIWKEIKSFIGVIIAAVASYFCAGTCGPAIWAAIGGASGAISAAVNGGNIFRGALIGAVTAGVAAGLADSSVLETFLANGFVGGVASEVSGGNFGHGFVAAGVSGLAGGAIGKIDNGVGRIVVRGVIGGTISEVTGGKFANGAKSAAFAQVVGEISNYATSQSSVSGRDNQVEGWSSEDEAWLQKTMAQNALDIESGNLYAYEPGWMRLQERALLDGEFGAGTYTNVMEDAGEVAIEGAATIAGGFGVYRAYKFYRISGLKIDGFSKGLRYGNGRIFQIRPAKGGPLFRLDYHPNPAPTKLHMHFGNMARHRPWYAPWKSY